VFALIGLVVLPEFDGRRKGNPPPEPGRKAADIPASAFDHAPYGVILVNLDGSKAYVNAAYSEITGYEPGETTTLAEGILKLFPDPDLRIEATKAWTDALEQSGIENTFPCTCKDGSVKEVQFRVAALDDGRMLLMMADVTAQKHAERTLQARLEIERVIAEISTKLVSSADIDAAIQESLGVLGSQRAASRAYVYRFSADGQTSSAPMSGAVRAWSP
jgi:PAS domain S-box-containing protein